MHATSHTAQKSAIGMARFRIASMGLLDLNELSGRIDVGFHDAEIMEKLERLAPSLLGGVSDRIAARIVDDEKLGKEVKFQILIGEVCFRRCLQECLFSLL